MIINISRIILITIFKSNFNFKRSEKIGIKKPNRKKQQIDKASPDKKKKQVIKQKMKKTNTENMLFFTFSRVREKIKK